MPIAVNGNTKIVRMFPPCLMTIPVIDGDVRLGREGLRLGTPACTQANSFNGARRPVDGLMPYCLVLMQNVSDDDQQKMLKAAQLLDATQMDLAIKVRILGLHLMNVVGPDVLTAAVEALRKDLESAPPPKAGGNG